MTAGLTCALLRIMGHPSRPSQDGDTCNFACSCLFQKARVPLVGVQELPEGTLTWERRPRGPGPAARGTLALLPGHRAAGSNQVRRSGLLDTDSSCPAGRSHPLDRASPESCLTFLGRDTKGSSSYP